MIRKIVYLVVICLVGCTNQYKEKILAEGIEYNDETFTMLGSGMIMKKATDPEYNPSKAAEMIELFIASGKNPNTKYKTASLLHAWALNSGDPGLLDGLLKAGVDSNQSEYPNPLDIAALMELHTVKKIQGKSMIRNASINEIEERRDLLIKNGAKHTKTFEDKVFKTCGSYKFLKETKSVCEAKGGNYEKCKEQLGFYKKWRNENSLLVKLGGRGNRILASEDVQGCLKKVLSIWHSHLSELKR